MADYDDKLNSALEPAVKHWFREQCRAPHTAMYFYYKPHHCAFYFGEDPLNEDWKLATGERVSGFKSERQIFNWAHSIATKLPVFPLES